MVQARQKDDESLRDLEASSRPAQELEKISAFLITFNEEQHIEECLRSLNFCDEILVIDSFSTDKTVDMARSLGAKVIQRKWPGYRAQKAFGLESVSHNWVLNVDADERIDTAIRDEILLILSGRDRNLSGQEIVGYKLNRVVFHLGRWWRSGGWYPEYRLRFFKKDSVVWGGEDPHEKPITSGRVEKLSGELHHYSYNSLEDQFKRLMNFAKVSAESSFLRGRRAKASDILFRPFLRSSKFFILKRGYREGLAGLIVALAEGMYTFMKYAYLWEMDKDFNKNSS